MRIAGALRHVVAPFFIELCQALKLLVEFFRLPALVLNGRLGLLELESTIGFELLLNQVPKLQHGRLQDLQTLLKLRCKDLLLG